MLKDITIGQFFPGNSAVHRLDPRVKIILTVAFIVLLFLAQGPVSYALIIAFLAVIIAISHISPKMVVRGLKPILLIVLFTAVLNLFYTPGDYIWQWKFLHISTQGIRMAIFMVLRLMLLIIATSMLTYTTSPIQLAAQEAACTGARAVHDDVDRTAFYPDPHRGNREDHLRAEGARRRF